MIDTMILLRLLMIYNLPYDVLIKIIIEWDICYKEPLEKVMASCFSQICVPILLENGGTRWERRTDFNHRKESVKYLNWASDEFYYMFAPYGKLLKNTKINWIFKKLRTRKLHPARFYSKMVDGGNVKCYFNNFQNKRNIHDYCTNNLDIKYMEDLKDKFSTMKVIDYQGIIYRKMWLSC